MFRFTKTWPRILKGGFRFPCAEWKQSCNSMERGKIMISRPHDHSTKSGKRQGAWEAGSYEAVIGVAFVRITKTWNGAASKKKQWWRGNEREWDQALVWEAFAELTVDRSMKPWILVKSNGHEVWSHEIMKSWNHENVISSNHELPLKHEIMTS